MKHIFSVIFALLLFSGIVNAQSVERSYEALEYLQTNDELIYQGIHIPVLDISYHEFSSDSITWRKDYQSGDCYVRFANTTSNTTNPYTAKQGYHDTWWGLNICNLGGESGGIDTMFVYYYQSDTIFQIDTVVLDGTNLDLKIPSPKTLTGSTTNYSDTSYHTHAVNLYMGDIRNVDTTGVQNGQVLKWNSVSGEWIIADDLIAGGALGQLSVQDVDGTPLVNNVTNIKVEDGHLVDNGAGSVTISFDLEPVNGEQDFYRTDTVDAVAGNNTITFSRPLPATDYVVTNAYALYSNGERQSLSYDSKTVNGFRVLDVIGESQIHYEVVRNLDSLFLAISDQGKVLASATDNALNFLDSKTDDNTIAIIGDKLSFIADTVDLSLLTSDDLVIDGDSIRATTQVDATDTVMATYEWVLSVAAAGNGWDSITKSTNEEYYIWWYAGAKIDSVQRTGIFLEIADSASYVTPSNLSETIANTDGLKTMVYHITLPASGTLIGRIAAATDVPTGWVLTSSGADLQVEHNLGRRVASVSVFAITGTEEQQLFNTAAYNGVKTPDSNNLTIQSLATSFASKDIVVRIIFE